MDTFLQAVGALVPSIGVGLLFYVAIRAIIRADRDERAAVARFEAERRVSAHPDTQGGGPSTGAPSPSSR